MAHKRLPLLGALSQVLKACDEGKQETLRQAMWDAMPEDIKAELAERAHPIAPVVAGPLTLEQIVAKAVATALAAHGGAPIAAVKEPQATYGKKKRRRRSKKSCRYCGDPSDSTSTKGHCTKHKIIGMQMAGMIG